VVGGIDTHADVHVVAVLDEHGGLLATGSFTADVAGYTRLHSWLESHGPIIGVGVEGTGSYGAGVARFLRSHHLTVHEVMRPDRSTRRRVGKSDHIDAEAAARAVLAGRALAIPKSRDGAVEAVRVLRVARRSAVRARTQAHNQITALVGASDDTLRAELRPLPPRTRIHTCAGFDPVRATIDPIDAARSSLGVIARRWQQLDTEITILDAQLGLVVPEAAGALLDVFGVGPHAAAQLLAAGDNPHRLRSEAAFAALCGVCPLPASSGKPSATDSTPAATAAPTTPGSASCSCARATTPTSVSVSRAPPSRSCARSHPRCRRQGTSPRR
jgi:transposase